MSSKAKSSCRIRKFAIDVTFTIRLPELKQGSKLSADVRKNFAAFYAFAKKHEETHRSIWLQCAAETEAAVNAISAKNLSRSEPESAAGDREDERLPGGQGHGVRQRRAARLARHPFIKQALAENQLRRSGRQTEEKEEGLGCRAFMPKPKALIIPVTPFQQNCCLIWQEETKRGAVIDPGGDVEAIARAITQSGVAVEQILLTHGHIDHAGGAMELSETLAVPIVGPQKEDLFLLSGLETAGIATTE